MRILVPVGLYTSPYPYRRLPKILGRSNVEAIVFTAIPIPQPTSLDHIEDSDIEIVKKYREKQDVIGQLLREFGFRVSDKIVYARDVAEAIQLEIREHRYDLVVLVKRKRLPRFIGRSVSRTLLGKIDTPILILTMEE